MADMTHHEIYDLYRKSWIVSKLCREFALAAELFMEIEVDTVIGPAVGGVSLAQWTGYHLYDIFNKEVISVHADKAVINGEDTFVIKRGYDKDITGKRVLVVEDILNTGGSIRKVVETVRSLGGIVAAVASLCNRGGVTTDDLGGVPHLLSLLTLNLESFAEEDCPFCKSGVPINTQFGKGADFVARQ